MDSDEHFSEAQKRIQWCFEKGRDHLNLNGLRIGSLPDEFSKLNGLRYLDLTDTGLTEFPLAITSFHDLKWLGLNFNQIQNLPEKIGELKSLQRLYLRGNHLQHLPDSIGQLAELAELDCHSNRIANLPTSLLQLLERTEDHRSLYYNFEKNPGQITVVASQGPSPFVAYLSQLKSDSEDDLQTVRAQGKLLLVGEGDVGKSTLLAALRDQPFLKNRERSHGLKVEPLSLDTNQGSMDLNCWDFSGQTELRETHQIFFTEPAIYLLIWNARQSDRNARLQDWLWLIKHRTEGRARVLIVVTECGNTNAEVSDAESIRREFGSKSKTPILIEPVFLQVECNPKAPGGVQGISKLKETLQTHLESNESFHQNIPQDWAIAQKALWDNRVESPFMEWSEFSKFCQRYNIPDPESFARASHRLGRMIWIDREQLRKKIILNPDFFSTAIGFIIHHKSKNTPLSGNNIPRLASGLLTQKEIHEKWATPNEFHEDGTPIKGFDKRIFTTLHLLMEAFDLSQPITGRVKQHLIPNRLSSETPAAWWDNWTPPETTIRRRIDLLGFDEKPLNDWLCSSILSRLMVRLHPDALGRDDFRQAAHWNRGFRLQEHDYGEARIHLEKNSLFFEGYGFGAGPEYLLKEVERAIATLTGELNQSFSYKVRSLTHLSCPAPCSREIELRYFLEEEKVHTMTQRSIPVMCQRPDCDQDFPATQFITNIRARVIHEPHPSETILEQIACNVQEIKDTTRGTHHTLHLILADQRATISNLENQHQEISHWCREQTALTQNMIEQIHSFRSDLKNQISNLLVSLDSPSRRGPCLFSILPKNPQFLTDNGKLFEEKFELLLHCEHCLVPTRWLEHKNEPLSFNFTIPRKWLVKAAPYLTATSKLLTWLAPTAGLLGSAQIGGFAEASKTFANAGKLADQFDQLLTHPDFIDCTDDSPGPLKPTEAEDTLLDWLHQFLAEKTKTPDLVKASSQLGLKRVRAKDTADYRWLHPTQATHYAE